MEDNSVESQMELCGLEDFKISLEDNPELGVEAIEKLVVAKMYPTKSVFNGLLRSILGRKWRLAKGWKLQEVERNTFILRLTKKQEAMQIARNGPWNICDGFLVVKPMPEDGKWSSADLNSSLIWVRVYEVPPRYWTRKYANALAQKVGSVISIDRMWRNGFPTNEYIRFQVNIQLNKPIMVGVFLPMEEGRKRRMIADDCNRTAPMYGPWIRLGSRQKGCFSNYELYEQDRLNREIVDAQNQAEARQNLIPGVDNFEPALIGTELHMEALAEPARREAEEDPLLVLNEEGETVLGGSTAEEECPKSENTVAEGQGQICHNIPNVHGKDVEVGGEVLAHDSSGAVCGPTTLSKNVDISLDAEDFTLGNRKKRRFNSMEVGRGSNINLKEQQVHNLKKKVCPGKVSNSNITPDHNGTDFTHSDCGESKDIGVSQELERQSGGSSSVGRISIENVSQYAEKEKANFVGSSGRLALFWRQGWDVHVMNMDTNKIVVKFGGDRFSSDWMVMGDLNSVLSANEKSGGKEVTRGEGEDLRNFILNHGAIDLMLGVGITIVAELSKARGKVGLKVFTASFFATNLKQLLRL
ncbi:hypothetical protein F8388_003865 [Cannabis sativa]|uniref:DUF4283 domain-containing protein n=1 Tax=Cannabis sativa TaxID=3483 RepID=A0A7J6I0G7_CANSA|nr:hypothetical protein F8388_003865 [Cannabis sativa]KAF4401014.1 hypothetical protein G4B88_013855 [Cannabis sativa]